MEDFMEGEDAFEMGVLLLLLLLLLLEPMLLVLAISLTVVRYGLLQA